VNNSTKIGDVKKIKDFHLNKAWKGYINELKSKRTHRLNYNHIIYATQVVSIYLFATSTIPLLTSWASSQDDTRLLFKVPGGGGMLTGCSVLGSTAPVDQYVGLLLIWRYSAGRRSQVSMRLELAASEL
jgi:hypothetical protein